METNFGKGILGGIEEARLEDILDDLRKLSHTDGNSSNPHARYIKPTHWPALDDLILRHFRETHEPGLSVRGRYLPLLYKIITILVSPPHSLAVYVLDLEGRFDATRLACAEPDLQHIYVRQPRRDFSSSSSQWGPELLAEAEEFMLYGSGAEPSASRHWWGTIVIGGAGSGVGGDLRAGWRGWLCVDRESVPDMEFFPGMSLKEAYELRAARQEAVDAAGWVASSPWGSIVFHEWES